MKLRALQLSFAAGLFAILTTQGANLTAQQPPAAIGDATIPSAVLLQPNELVPMLRTPEKPLLFQVGSHVLYAEAHIPGSEYVGAAGTADGAQALRQRVSGLGKDQPIVLYCGCCPWSHCPNIRAAYQLLHSLAFTRLRVLYLATNFGTDWVDQGYPVAKSR